jgi:uncharacterized protein YndB with AHSA1/START domain
MTDSATRTLTFERTYAHTAERVWQLSTTKEGIESWWGPDGFDVTVNSLDLRVGGGMTYTTTATAPEEIEFMKQADAPLSSETTITFTEVDAPNRLAFSTPADFIPGVSPYDVHTVVEIEALGDRVRMTITADVMHDEFWTELSRICEENQLAKLDKLLGKDT